MALLDIYPESGEVDEQSQDGYGEELQLQVERQDLQQHLNFSLHNRSEHQQLHNGLLLLLLLASQLCEVEMGSRGDIIIYYLRNYHEKTMRKIN